MTRMLTRETVTLASRIMLPLYPVLYGSIGIAFLIQAPSRTAGDAFDVARMLMPIPVWGVLFIVIALAEVLALLLNDRRLYLLALIPGAGLATFWASILMSGGLVNEHVSFTSGMWVLGMSGAQVASARSVARNEVP